MLVLRKAATQHTRIQPMTGNVKTSTETAAAMSSAVMAVVGETPFMAANEGENKENSGGPTDHAPT